ncbi:Uncharacterised protein [Vibrio cholerae]|nr:Uncharacterised protein [Vibrio cholerae]
MFFCVLCVENVGKICFVDNADNKISNCIRK